MTESGDLAAKRHGISTLIKRGILDSLHSKKGHLWRNHSLDIVALILGISLILGLWTFATTYGNYPNFVLPEPNAVFKELKIVLANGLLWYHLKATLTEMMGGLALGLSLAVVLGYVLGKSPLLERFFDRTS